VQANRESKPVGKKCARKSWTFNYSQQSTCLSGDSLRPAKKIIGGLHVRASENSCHNSERAVAPLSMPQHRIYVCERKEVKFYDPGSGLAEIFALAWVFIALVIGEVGLYILRWFTLGFDYARNGFGPSTGCASPSCKPRVFLKNELSARGRHHHSFPQGGVDYQPRGNSGNSVS
jgi:hypothetical protein